MKHSYRSDIMHPKESKGGKDTKKNKKAGIVRSYYYLAPASLCNVLLSYVSVICICGFLKSMFSHLSRLLHIPVFLPLFLNTIVVGRATPIDMQVLIPGTSEYASLCSKGILQM